VVIFTPWLLQPQERTLVLNEEEAGWAPEMVWTFMKREKPLASNGIQTLVCLACSAVTVLTTLLWLYPYS